MLCNLCAACRFINRPTARRCEACGAALGDFDTVPQALTRAGALADGLDSQVGALWFDDLSPPRGAPARPPTQPPTSPPSGVQSSAQSGPPSSPPRTAPSTAPSTASSTAPSTAPRTPPRTAPSSPLHPARDVPPAHAPALPGMTVLEIRLGQPATPAVRPLPARVPPPASALAATPPALALPALPAPLAPAPAAGLPTDRAARAAIKVARRAAVRHARQAAAPALPAVGDVLVMDADAVARNHLDDLLGDFGFRVRPVASLAQAALLADFHPFAAVFVAVPPGAVDGAVHDIFEQVRATGLRAGVAPAVRVLVAAQWSPVDRVRAELAGCEATLVKPPSRRDVARVLDANGVVLPRDPRRL